MRELGIRGAFSRVSLGLVLSCVGVACATSEQAQTEPASEAPAATFAGMRKNPEQVVQRMEPQSGRVAQAPVTRSSISPGAARAQSAPGALAEAPDGQQGAAEHITPRHLEAELNRLEAELAN